MSLEEESKTIYFKKKQVEKIKKRVLKEYFDKQRRYSVDDINDLFDGTNIPKEIIHVEIKREVKKDRYFFKRNNEKDSKLEKTSKEDNFPLKFELKRNIKNNSPKENPLKKYLFEKGPLSFLMGFIQGILCMPSYFIKYELKENKEEYSAIKTGRTFGFMSSPILFSCAAYVYFFEKKPLAATILLATQIGANTLDLSYKIFRTLKNRK